jgi:hypothetical protein
MSDVNATNNIILRFNRYAPIPILTFGLQEIIPFCRFHYYILHGSLTLLVQLITIVICTLPIVIQKLYTIFTGNISVETLIVLITRHLMFLNSSATFYG